MQTVPVAQASKANVSYLSIREAAKALGLDVNQVRTRILQRLIPSRKEGRLRVINRSEIEWILESQRREGAEVEGVGAMPSDNNRRPYFGAKAPAVRVAYVLVIFFLLPLTAHASPFDTGITNVQTLFTGTIAKAVSLIAVVLGGLGFAFGEPGAKKGLAMLAIGIGIALLAANVISWLWSA